MSDTTTATGTREANADRRKADNRSRIEASSNLGTLDTLRRGIQLSPELLHGIGWTLLLAVLAATGRIVVPLTVQHVIDDGILADGGPDGGRIAVTITVAVLALSLAALCSAMVNVRLVRRAEAGLASLRIRAFRHIHDLSALTQNTERRGALLSRVTSDIDTISQFVSFGGIMLVVSSLQLAVATVLMVRFSWALALVVWGCFIPLYLLLRLGAPYVRGRFMRVRERTGLLLGAMSEAVVGAETVRAYGIA
ncbi:MAG: ABC transporter ATP-binding protein, partial [Cellulomonadaceae bacterium]|nr:ABC transporter ATP-binding protein [Cellulomonadaceae bacterium]